MGKETAGAVSAEWVKKKEDDSCRRSLKPLGVTPRRRIPQVEVVIDICQDQTIKERERAIRTLQKKKP